MNRRLRVGVIFGGQSGEHEVSLASARSVLAAMDPAKYEPVLIGITKQGRWLAGGNPLKKLVQAAGPSVLTAGAVTNGALNGDGPTSELVAVEQMNESLSPLQRVDVVLPLVHGPMGEDGTIQGLLELAHLPYVGAGVAASAVGMDKHLMKEVFRAAGLPVVDSVMVRRFDWERDSAAVYQEVEARLGYPVFVKPANMGSSVGVTKVRGRTELAGALTLAARYDRKLLVERSVDAREIECSVLGNEEPLASLPGEVIPEREFYDYTAKYDPESNTRLIVPADLSQAQTDQVRDLAVRAFLATDCAGMARVDFFLERQTGRLWLNEINTIPGFTAVSMYPRMWEASGLSYPQLIDRLIELAMERHREKHKGDASD